MASPSLLLLGANNSLQNAVAEGDTRTLSFHHVHTGEDITITFKRNGRYDEAALKKLDWFMRDWRKEQETHMDPHLFDLLWEVYREVGGTAADPGDLRLSLAGHQRDAARALERRRADQPAHQRPGDRLLYSRRAARDGPREGLRLQRGGVGFYPTSGSPFVHMDTGTIRHWPRIPREELVKIFPDGRTVHIPSDGQPLPGYALALADVERHGAMPSGTSLEAAREAGVITARPGTQTSRSPKRSLLASLFGRARTRMRRASSRRPSAAARAAHGRRQPEPTQAGRGRAHRAAAGGAAEAG